MMWSQDCPYQNQWLWWHALHTCQSLGKGLLHYKDTVGRGHTSSGISGSLYEKAKLVNESWMLAVDQVRIWM